MATDCCTSPAAPRRESGHWRRWLTATAGASALAGCAVFNPVPDAALGGRLLPRLSGTAGLSDAAASASGSTTSDSATASHTACAGSGEFVGALDQAICEIDTRRLAYLRRSAEVLNGNANYNAALWPLGAAAVYEKLRGAPNAKLLLPATLGAAAYGFIKAGIPDRQKVYLAASRELACAIVAAGPDLYRTEEIDFLSGKTLQSPAPLRTELRELGLMIDTYDSARANLLAALRPRPGKSAVAAPASGNVFDRGRSTGSGRAAQPGADSRPDVASQTQARLAHARGQLALGQALLRRLESGAPAAALLARAARIDDSLHQQLADKAPLPANPASVAGEINGFAKAMLKLEASLANADSTAPPDPLDSALPFAASDGLDADSRLLLRDFQQRQAAALRRASQRVADWLVRHRAGRDDMATVLEQAGCTPAGSAALQTATEAATDVVNKAAKLANAANAANRAARPATANSPGAAQTPNNGSAPAAGTPLDKP